MTELKPPLTFAQQLEKLEARGCVVDNKIECELMLERVNYYRITAYLLPFRQEDGNYMQGTSFKKICNIYEFDRKFRNIIFSAIEEIEVYFRTQLAYYHGHKYGADGYMSVGTFGLRHDHDKFLDLIKNEIDHNKTLPFVQHHMHKYNGKFPIWTVTELFSFGMISHFYADMETPDKKRLARMLFDTTYNNLESWLRCCTDLRNICAHYGRLYYRIFSAIPATPKNLKINLNHRLLFDNIVMLKFLYPDKKKWQTNVLAAIETLIGEYECDIELSHIGFPNDWYELLRELEIPKKKMA